MWLYVDHRIRAIRRYLLPVAKHPLRRDYFVYSMAAAGQSFYVGIGHKGRASDRVRYVKYLMKRQRAGYNPKWVLSNEVIARLIRVGLEVKPKYLCRGLTRPQALVEERSVIRRFRKRGFVVANRQHNGGSVVSVSQVIADVRRRISARR